MKRWTVLVLLIITAAIAFFASERGDLRETDADKRIDFYKERLGGRGTYPAYARLGMAYLQKARETGDATYLVRAEEKLLDSMKFQSNFEAIRALAFLSMEKHEFRMALDYAKEALDTVPSDLETKGILSDAYWALGNRPEAMKLVQELLARGENFAGLSRLAVVRFSDGDAAGAIESMQRACVFGEQESRPVDNRAWCYTRLGTYLISICDGASAERAYRKALSYLPNYSYARRELDSLGARQKTCGSRRPSSSPI